MELKTFSKGCLVVTIALVFAACNNEQAAKNETTNQEVNMQQPSDTAAMQKIDSTAAKMENEKEENEKDDD